MSEEDVNNEEEQEEEDKPSGPISGALPTAGDIFEMVGGCECGGISAHELCCPEKQKEGNSKDGSPAAPADPTPVGTCKLFETNISMALGPHLGFALEFEVVLDIPPKPPIPTIPPLPHLGIPLNLDVPAFGLPLPSLGLPLPKIPMPGMNIPGFFPEPLSLDLPPFPGLPFFGLTLFPINFALGLFTLDIKIPIPTAEPCDLVEATGMPCPPIPGIPMLNIAICFLCLLCLLLMIIMPILVILVGMGVVKIGNDGKMLDENGEEVQIPPPLIIGNPEDNRESVNEDTPKINEFNVGEEVTLVAKKYDLKQSFSNNRFRAGPDNFDDTFEVLPEDAGTVRAGTIEGDENEDGTPGPEEPNMRYEWKIYAPEEVDETDVVAFIESMGFTVEDSEEKNEDGTPVVPAGTFVGKKLSSRTPIHTVTKTSRRHGADARRLSFSFPKVGNFEVMCFATKMAGSQPDLETVRLQTIIKVGEVDSDGVWRSVKKVTELPEVLKEMRMPEGLEKIKRTPYPLDPESMEKTKKLPAKEPVVETPQPPIEKPPTVIAPEPRKKDKVGV